MTSQDEQQRMWALVELFGHNRIAGEVREAEIGGGQLIRVDVPAVKGRDALTKYFNVKSLYAITPVTEATALRMAEEIQPEPVSNYSLERYVAQAMKNRSERGLPAGDDGEDEL